MTFHAPNRYRVREGALKSVDEDGNNGAFLVPFESYTLCCIASDGGGWEHVSVSLKHRTPSWKQMCFIKDLFWDAEDCCVQYHPPQSEYVNNHEHCLHIWRPINEKLPCPPSSFVGLLPSSAPQSVGGWSIVPLKMR